MFVLLDTHALIWLDQDNPAPGPEARKSADLALPAKVWRRDLLGLGLLRYPLTEKSALQPRNSTCTATRRIASSPPRQS
jgi:hypothetical protein